jgi:hypothetical protein
LVRIAEEERDYVRVTWQDIAGVVLHVGSRVGTARWLLRRTVFAVPSGAATHVDPGNAVSPEQAARVAADPTVPGVVPGAASRAMHDFYG